MNIFTDLLKLNDVKKAAKELIKERNIHLKPVCSYTTRPKRDSETEGVEHYFITPEEAKNKLESEKILAYTKIGNYEYFSTLEGLNGANLYIIDPNGITYLKQHFPELNCKVIYIWTPDHIRENRCKDRSDYETKFKLRCQEEDEQFTEFEKNKDWDCYINNGFGLDNSLSTILSFILNEKDSMFLIVGRTGSGKDYLMREVLKLVNEVWE